MQGIIKVIFTTIFLDIPLLKKLWENILLYILSPAGLGTFSVLFIEEGKRSLGRTKPATACYAMNDMRRLK